MRILNAISTELANCKVKNSDVPYIGNFLRLDYLMKWIKQQVLNPMKTNLLLALTLALLVSSCCTLMNQRTTEVNIYSDVDSAVICFGPDSEKYILPLTLELPRSKYDFYFTVEKDSMKRPVILENKLSPTFWWGNMFSGPGGLGYLVDLTNPKRFTYPPEITVPFNSSPRSRAYWKWVLPVKGQFTFKFSAPAGNFFYLDKLNGHGTSGGFMGISAGFDYYFSDKYSIGSDIGAMGNLIFPLPYMDVEEDYSIPTMGIYAADYMYYQSGDYASEQEYTNARYIDLQVGTDMNSFHFDVGIQANRTKWNYYKTIQILPYFHKSMEFHRISVNAGAALSCYYRVSEKFNLGFNFYPSFISIYNHHGELAYTHQGNFELIWKFRVYRPPSKTAGYRMPCRP
jgi:hypothetical protein